MTREDTRRANAYANQRTVRRLFSEDAAAYPELAGKPREIVRLYTLARIHEIAEDKPRYKNLVGKSEPYGIATVMAIIHGTAEWFGRGEFDDLMPERKTPKAQPINVIEINDRLTEIQDALKGIATKLNVVHAVVMEERAQS